MKNFYRKKIAEGVYFNQITDKRFKLNRTTISFMMPLDEETAPCNALLARMLTASNIHYPETAMLRNREAALYSSTIAGGVSKTGDTQRIDFAVSCIDNSYALGPGEDVMTEANVLLLQCLFSPVIFGGQFVTETFAVEKQNLINEIHAEMNDKRVYARKRLISALCAGEPFAVSSIGTAESVAKITKDRLFDAYRHMLSSAHVEIFCAGCSEFDGFQEMFATWFDSGKYAERHDIAPCKSAVSALRGEQDELVEKMSVVQSKLVMGFKSTSRDHAALQVMSKIYGGTSNAKLFMNVREKLSLCYYCYSMYTREKGIMLVESGVEDANIEKARAEILHQLEEVRRGNFTDEEIHVALSSVKNDMKTYNDSLASITEWYLLQNYRGTAKAPEEVTEEYMAVTRKKIIKAAQSVSLDTTYILTGEGANGND